MTAPAFRHRARASSRAGLLPALLLLFATWFGAAGAAAQDGLEALTIEAGGRSHAFQVEVMRTDEQRAKGLMFRRYLADDRGMLFDFETERTVAMWMKNTYLPLDMIFIGKDGKVVGLAENTEPMSERVIPSGAPALAVLEVNAGTVQRIGLKIGDRVRQKLFGG